MRKMYLTYPILQTVSAKLTWSHYIELLKIDDPLERSFYEKECEEEHGNIIRYIKESTDSMFPVTISLRLRTRLDLKNAGTITSGRDKA